MHIIATGTEEQAVYSGHFWAPFIQATQYCPCSHKKLNKKNVFSIFMLFTFLQLRCSGAWCCCHQGALGLSGPFLPYMVCLYKHHLAWTHLQKCVFLRISGSFATKRLWTSHALHQSQEQGRNRLTEHRFLCSCVFRTDQSPAQSAVPLFKWLSHDTDIDTIYFWYCYYASSHLAVPFTPSVETHLLSKMWPVV